METVVSLGFHRLQTSWDDTRWEPRHPDEPVYPYEGGSEVWWILPLSVGIPERIYHIISTGQYWVQFMKKDLCPTQNLTESYFCSVFFATFFCVSWNYHVLTVLYCGDNRGFFLPCTHAHSYPYGWYVDKKWLNPPRGFTDPLQAGRRECPREETKLPGFTKILRQ